MDVLDANNVKISRQYYSTLVNYCSLLTIIDNEVFGRRVPYTMHQCFGPEVGVQKTDGNSRFQTCYKKKLCSDHIPFSARDKGIVQLRILTLLAS